MKEIVRKIRDFERRNSISVLVSFFSDGSSCMRDLMDESDTMATFDDLNALRKYLREVNFVISPDGSPFKPYRLLCDDCGATGQYYDNSSNLINCEMCEGVGYEEV